MVRVVEGLRLGLRGDSHLRRGLKRLLHLGLYGRWVHRRRCEHEGGCRHEDGRSGAHLLAERECSTEIVAGHWEGICVLGNRLEGAHHERGRVLGDPSSAIALEGDLIASTLLSIRLTANGAFWRTGTIPAFFFAGLRA